MKGREDITTAQAIDAALSLACSLLRPEDDDLITVSTVRLQHMMTTKTVENVRAITEKVFHLLKLPAQVQIDRKGARVVFQYDGATVLWDEHGIREDLPPTAFH